MQFVGRPDSCSFVGRTDEMELLRRELAAARGGSSRVVLIQGVAGIGKTALIDRLLVLEADVAVLRACGEKWEASVAFGVVDQLVDSTRPSRTKVSAERVYSLPSEDPIHLGRQLLRSIDRLQDTSTVIIIVDDAQWADEESLRAVLFVTRRLADVRVLTLLAQRSDDPRQLPEGLRKLARGRTGTTLDLFPLPAREIPALAKLHGVQDLSPRLVRRLYDHTGGNPQYISTLFSEVPREQWRSWEPVLPAPRSFAAEVVERYEACALPTRRLVEAAAVLGGSVPVSELSEISNAPEVIPILDQAVGLNLLRLSGDDSGRRCVTFVHPMVRATVYSVLGPARLVALHRAAARLAVDDAAALRHRALATAGPDSDLAAELAEFARSQAAFSAWATVASAFIQAARLAADRWQREEHLLSAIDAMIDAGELRQAESTLRQLADDGPRQRSEATVGHLAVMRGRPAKAEQMLSIAWQDAEEVGDVGLGALVAQRMALHAMGRLRGTEMVQWCRRAMDMASPDEPAAIGAQTLLGLGLGLQGDLVDGLKFYEAAVAELSGRCPLTLHRLKIGMAWLRLVDDDVFGAREILESIPMTSGGQESAQIAVWSSVWLAHADFALGSWDDSSTASRRAVSLAEDLGLEWLRPLAHLSAILVAAARGAWAAAEGHARSALAQSDHYELMQVTASLAHGHLAFARADHYGVLHALEPIARLSPRAELNEPGFWAWQDLYGDSLVTAGRLDEAEALLAVYEPKAAARGRRSVVARLARVRGRLAAARGDIAAADRFFQHGLSIIGPLSMPFQQALHEYSYGQVLRRAGRRRDAAQQLTGARDRFDRLLAVPYLERCERELAACGLAPTKRRSFDPSRLTAQESAVAQLVATGSGNRQVAAELFISIKTVQFHLTNIYAKLGIRTRAELAAQFRDLGDDRSEHLAVAD